jgi:hypothetical protein
MHGMICKTLEMFLRSQHGEEAWSAIRRAAGVQEERLEALHGYPDAMLRDLLVSTRSRLQLPIHAILDDIATWLCVHPPLEPVRRLIRFSGPTFVDLLWSLEELPDRAALAVPDLAMPLCRVREPRPGSFAIEVEWHHPCAGAFISGLLRTMADDYGTLVRVDWGGRMRDGDRFVERLEVELVMMGHGAARPFALGPGQ